MSVHENDPQHTQPKSFHNSSSRGRSMPATRLADISRQVSEDLSLQSYNDEPAEEQQQPPQSAGATSAGPSWANMNAHVKIGMSECNVESRRDRLVFDIYLILIGGLGLLRLGHQLLRSAYTNRIDSSPWSVTFWVLSYSKEVALVVVFLHLLLCAVIPGVAFDYGILACHGTIILLLGTQLRANKTISSRVTELRNHFLRTKAHWHNLPEGAASEGISEVPLLHRDVRKKLFKYIAIEAVLLFLSLGVNYVYLPRHHWHIIVALFIAALEFISNVVVSVLHYRDVDPHLLKGRFRD